MEFATARNRMVESQLISRGIKDTRLLDAMRKIPRHRFVEEALISQAYNDHPLPIGEKQELAEKIYSIERIRSLILKAQRILDELGYFNVVLKAGDGTLGLKEEAPFDGIIVTAGSPDVPQPLVDQLAMGGNLVIPVGDRYTQSLMKVVRVKEGIVKTDLGGCRFVNLLGRHGWEE